MQASTDRVTAAQASHLNRGVGRADLDAALAPTPPTTDSNPCEESQDPPEGAERERRESLRRHRAPQGRAAFELSARDRRVVPIRSGIKTGIETAIVAPGVKQLAGIRRHRPIHRGDTGILGSDRGLASRLTPIAALEISVVAGFAGFHHAIATDTSECALPCREVANPSAAITASAGDPGAAKTGIGAGIRVIGVSVVAGLIRLNATVAASVDVRA